MQRCLSNEGPEEGVGKDGAPEEEVDGEPLHLTHLRPRLQPL